MGRQGAVYIFSICGMLKYEALYTQERFREAFLGESGRERGVALRDGVQFCAIYIYGTSIS
jgi:hypothetical protein